MCYHQPPQTFQEQNAVLPKMNVSVMAIIR